MKKLVAIIVVLLLTAGAALLLRAPQKPYYLSIAAIMKNEKPYLKELL